MFVYHPDEELGLRAVLASALRDASLGGPPKLKLADARTVSSPQPKKCRSRTYGSISLASELLHTNYGEHPAEYKITASHRTN